MNTSAWTRYQAFLVRETRDSPAAVLWDELCRLWPELSFADTDGVQSVDLSEHLSCRWFIRLSDGVFGCEAIDLNNKESWQVFAVPSSGGSSVGWSRRGRDAAAPPSIWTNAIQRFELGPRAELKRDPDFISLLSTLAGDLPQLAVAYQDYDTRRELSLESDYWRDTARRQAEQLRQAKAMAAAVTSPQGSRAKPGSLVPGAGLAVPTTAQTSSVIPAETFSNEFKEFAWTDLQHWADLHVDRIFIVPRALAEAKKALYAEPSRALEALEMLATTYRAAKRSEIDRRELKDHAERLGLFIGGSVDPSRAGEAGDEYFIRYGGRRRFLDQHVGRGNSRDPRFTLRIYFTWCEETERVVVGWLPTHLHSSGS